METTTDTDALIREALETVRGQLPQARERVTKAKDELADAQEVYASLEDKERRYALAIGLKLPKASAKAKPAPDPEKPKRGRPPKAKAIPPPEELPPAEAKADRPLYPDSAEVHCTRKEPPCGWFGKQTETKNGRCPREDCYCFVVEITEEERA